MKINKTNLILIIITILILLSNPKCDANSDPWFYRDKSFLLSVPDKYQHFFGSYMIADQTTPTIALTLGILKEIDDSRKTLFSWRDLFADTIGIIAATRKDKNITIWIDYDQEENILILSMKVRF